MKQRQLQDETNLSRVGLLELLSGVFYLRRGDRCLAQGALAGPPVRRWSRRGKPEQAEQHQTTTSKKGMARPDLESLHTSGVDTAR